MSTEVSAELFSAVSGDPDDRTLPIIVLCHGTMDRSAGMLRLARQLVETPPSRAFFYIFAIIVFIDVISARIESAPITMLIAWSM